MFLIDSECVVNCFKDTEIHDVYGDNEILFNETSFNKRYGYQIDGINHNYLLHEEYVILGYSYMSFVIKDKIEIEDKSVKQNVFDITPFNYLFNKSTSIIDSNDILNDQPSVFKKILQDILHYDKSYLNQLN